MRFVLASLAAALAVRAAPSQFPFSAASEPATFEVLKHDAAPEHAVRVRTPIGLCDTSVHQKAGYLDTPENRHFFFWLFESRSDPENDPIVLWLNGESSDWSFS